MEWEQVSLESISCLLPEMAIICPMKTPLLLFGNTPLRSFRKIAILFLLKPSSNPLPTRLFTFPRIFEVFQVRPQNTNFEDQHYWLVPLVELTVLSPPPFDQHHCYGSVLAEVTQCIATYLGMSTSTDALKSVAFIDVVTYWLHSGSPLNGQSFHLQLIVQHTHTHTYIYIWTAQIPQVLPIWVGRACCRTESITSATREAFAAGLRYTAWPELQYRG